MVKASPIGGALFIYLSSFGIIGRDVDVELSATHIFYVNMPSLSESRLEYNKDRRKLIKRFAILWKIIQKINQER